MPSLTQDGACAHP